MISDPTYEEIITIDNEIYNLLSTLGFTHIKGNGIEVVKYQLDINPSKRYVFMTWFGVYVRQYSLQIQNMESNLNHWNCRYIINPTSHKTFIDRLYKHFKSDLRLIKINQILCQV